MDTLMLICLVWMWHSSLLSDAHQKEKAWYKPVVNHNYQMDRVLYTCLCCLLYFCIQLASNRICRWIENCFVLLTTDFVSQIPAFCFYYDFFYQHFAGSGPSEGDGSYVPSYQQNFFDRQMEKRNLEEVWLYATLIFQIHDK